MTQQTSGDSFLKLSRDLFREKRFAEAAEILQIMLEQDPKDEVALEMLGMARFYNKELQAAREVFERHTKVNSGHTQAWVNLGAVLNRLGEFRKAVEALRRALQKDRKCAEAYYNMGIAQRGQNLNTMAISAYKEAIKLKPDLIEAHLNLGNIYVDMKNMGLALQCFQAAVRLDPNSKKARSSLEKAQMTQQNARRVVSPFGRLVDVKELDRQNVDTGPRELDAASRKAERELVQEVTRKVRAGGKEMLPLLEETLHAQLHRLERIVVQTENRFSSAENVESFSQTLGDLQRLRSVIKEGLAEIREHLT
ncbi:MAG: tetratricopeptide repeat protein [Planctomycetaceae bacterium]